MTDRSGRAASGVTNFLGLFSAVVGCCLVMAAGAAAPLPAAAEEILSIDAAHSTVGFTIGIAGGLTVVEGRFTGVEGEIRYDLDNPESSSVSAVVDASTIATGHEGRDEHLRSPDFFSVETHPQITFTSRGVEAGPDGMVLSGDLEMRGVRKPVELTVTRPHEAPAVWLSRRPTAIFEARTQVRREDFGLVAPPRWNRIIAATGELAMAEEVSIELRIVAEAPRPDETLVDVVLERGVEAAFSKVDWLAERVGGEAPTESILNALGYRLADHDLAAATRVLTENVRRYPQSSNVHDSLGEIHLRAGRIDAAVASYRRVLEVDPENGNARRTVRALAEPESLRQPVPAVGTRLEFPIGLAVLDGAVYVAERSASRVRRIDLAAGTMTLAAGNGVRGFGGEGGPAPEAWLHAPNDLAIAPGGDLIVSDTFNQRIRRIDSETGLIETMVGTGVAGYDGDGGLATEARIRGPYGLAFDRLGNLVFADTDNHVIRRVDFESGRIETLAGTGEAGFSGDGGPATEARFRRPHNVLVTPHGDLIIGDSFNQRIRRVDALTGVVTTIAGRGERALSPIGTPAAEAAFGYFGCLALDEDERLIVAEWTNNRIVAFDPEQPSSPLLSVAAGLGRPAGCSFDGKGGLFVVEAQAGDGGGRVRRIDLASGRIETVAGVGSEG